MKQRGMRGWFGFWRKYLQPFLWRRGRWACWIWMERAKLFWFGGPAAYKLDSNDVQIIETETGQQVADLAEAELVVAMRILSIRKLELDQNDIAALRQAEAREIC